MTLCFSPPRSAPFFLLMVMLLSTCASTVPFKVNNCCKKTGNSQIPAGITDCKMQRARGHCVEAVIFTSNDRHYCCNPNSPWVQNKLQELETKNLPCKSQTSSGKRRRVSS